MLLLTYLLLPWKPSSTSFHMEVLVGVVVLLAGWVLLGGAAGLELLWPGILWFSSIINHHRASSIIISHAESSSFITNHYQSSSPSTRRQNASDRQHGENHRQPVTRPLSVHVVAPFGCRYNPFRFLLQPLSVLRFLFWPLSVHGETTGNR